MENRQEHITSIDDDKHQCHINDESEKDENMNDDIDQDENINDDCNSFDERLIDAQCRQTLVGRMSRQCMEMTSVSTSDNSQMLIYDYILWCSDDSGPMMKNVDIK